MEKSVVDSLLARFAALPQCVALANYSGTPAAAQSPTGAAVLHAQSGLVLVAVLIDAGMQLRPAGTAVPAWGLALGAQTLLSAAEVRGTQLPPPTMAALVAACYQALSGPNAESRLVEILKDY